MPENSGWREEIRHRVEALGLAPEREAEIVEEIGEHLEDEFARAIASGMREAEARRQVLAELSDYPPLQAGLRRTERCGCVEPVVPGGKLRTHLLGDLGNDVRYAARVFRRNPGFAALAVLSLALGIGGNAAMFNMVSAVLLRPLPYKEPNRLVQAASTGYYPAGGLVALQERSRTMEVAGFRPGIDLNLTGEGDAWHIKGSAVSGNLFRVLGVGAELGSTFAAGDDQPGKDNLVILSDTLWRERFSADSRVIGRVITLGGVGRQVVGIMPPQFAFPDTTTRFWIPLYLDARNQNAYWAQDFMPIVGRLRDGATLAQAQSEIETLSKQMIALYPYPMGRDFNAHATVIPLQEFLVTNVRTRLIVLQCAIGLVLLIACANVANLLLARASSRQKEMALRTALGAARGRIVRQLLTESLMLACAGGGAGAALAAWGASALKPALPASMAGWSDFSTGWQVVLFAAALAVATGLIFGLAPAWVALRPDLAGIMKSGGQRSLGTGRARFRSALIVAEIALAVVLSVGAGLLIRTLWRLAQVDPGFQPQHIVTLRVSPNESLCRQRTTCIALYDELLRRTRQTSGVIEAAAANTVPLSDSIPTIPVVVEGQPYVPSERTAPLFWAGAVTPDYFRLMHIPILMGRDLAAGDGEKAAPVIVVSAGTARRYWPGQNPIGKHIRPVFEPAWRTVVGVAGDVRQYDLANHAPEFIAGAIYMPYGQAVQSDWRLPTAMTLMVRISGKSADITGKIRDIVRELNPNVPVSPAGTMESLVDESMQPSRSMAWLFAAFAGVALSLAAVGAYGVVSWSVAQRTFEMGVRVALGAPRSTVFALVLGQSFRLVLLGLVLGFGASFALNRLLARFMYDTASSDALTFSCVSMLMIAVALAAGYFPARRAARVDPLKALRVE